MKRSVIYILFVILLNYTSIFAQNANFFIKELGDDVSFVERLNNNSKRLYSSLDFYLIDSNYNITKTENYSLNLDPNFNNWTKVIDYNNYTIATSNYLVSTHLEFKIGHRIYVWNKTDRSLRCVINKGKDYYNHLFCYNDTILSFTNFSYNPNSVKLVRYDLNGITIDSTIFPNISISNVAVMFDKDSSIYLVDYFRPNASSTLVFKISRFNYSGLLLSQINVPGSINAPLLNDFSVGIRNNDIIFINYDTGNGNKSNYYINFNLTGTIKKETLFNDKLGVNNTYLGNKKSFYIDSDSTFLEYGIAKNNTFQKLFLRRFNLNRELKNEFYYDIIDNSNNLVSNTNGHTYLFTKSDTNLIFLANYNFYDNSISKNANVINYLKMGPNLNLIRANKITQYNRTALNIKSVDYIENDSLKIIANNFHTNNSGAVHYYRSYVISYNFIKDTVYEYVTTGLYNNLLDSTVIYPNPAYNELNIKTDKNIRYEIYNETGALVMKGIVQSTNTALDVSNLIRGIYLIKLEDEQGKMNTLKFIVNSN